MTNGSNAWVVPEVVTHSFAPDLVVPKHFKKQPKGERSTEQTNKKLEEISQQSCGLNCILDMTQDSLTNQRQLFSKENWSQMKALSSNPPFDNNLIQFRLALSKIDRVFKYSNH
ncbi:hypothetical protein V8B55DRAFT_1409222 [Mucor lusitanicus]